MEEASENRPVEDSVPVRCEMNCEAFRDPSGLWLRRKPVHIIQGRHVCADQHCKFKAWQMEPKR